MVTICWLFLSSPQEARKSKSALLSSPGDESEEEAGDNGEAEQDFEPRADHTLGEMQSIGKIIASIISSQNDDHDCVYFPGDLERGKGAAPPS